MTPCMQTPAVVLVTVLSAIVWASNMEPPIGKCKHPLPRLPGLNITQVEGDVFKYIYTPNSLIYKAVDSIAMMINKVKNKDNEYFETIKARSILGACTDLTLKVIDMGDGILKKVTKDGEMSYIASIVDIKGDVAMLYVCSDEGEDTKQDFRFVIARKSVDARSVDHPDVLFNDTNDRYNFTGNFRRLPQRWAKKLFKI